MLFMVPARRLFPIAFHRAVQDRERPGGYFSLFTSDFVRFMQYP
jgi:hypothetical protein